MCIFICLIAVTVTAIPVGIIAESVSDSLQAIVEEQEELQRLLGLGKAANLTYTPMKPQWAETAYSKNLGAPMFPAAAMQTMATPPAPLPSDPRAEPVYMPRFANQENAMFVPRPPGHLAPSLPQPRQTPRLEAQVGAPSGGQRPLGQPYSGPPGTPAFGAQQLGQYGGPIGGPPPSGASPPAPLPPSSGGYLRGPPVFNAAQSQTGGPLPFRPTPGGLPASAPEFRPNPDILVTGPGNKAPPGMRPPLQHHAYQPGIPAHGGGQHLHPSQVHMPGVTGGRPILPPGAHTPAVFGQRPPFQGKGPPPQYQGQPRSAANQGPARQW